MQKYGRIPFGGHGNEHGLGIRVERGDKKSKTGRDQDEKHVRHEHSVAYVQGCSDSETNSAPSRGAIAPKDNISPPERGVIRSPTTMILALPWHDLG